LHAPVDLEALIGESPPMLEVKTLIRKLGPTRSNVLITGESGTGKELVARALHAQGLEPDAPFLAINCAAIPHELLENQLFGHIRGSFTGADRDRSGLPLLTQAKLLRAIEAKEVLPIGANRPEPIAARVVAATNKDLAAEVQAARFREDLYYRLNVVSIHLPPLRERPEDIPDLIAVLLTRHARAMNKRIDGLDNASVRRLAAAPWKGNVRELGNALERAAILGEGSTLTLEDFPGDLLAATPLDDNPDDLRAALDRFERQHIRRVLDRCQGDKKEAARRLNLGLSSLYRKLEDPA
jgi:DNA-binding NtrC family response regulator